MKICNLTGALIEQKQNTTAGASELETTLKLELSRAHTPRAVFAQYCKFTFHVNSVNYCAVVPIYLRCVYWHCAIIHAARNVQRIVCDGCGR